MLPKLPHPILPWYQLWCSKQQASSCDVDQFKDCCCHHQAVETGWFGCQGESEDAGYVANGTYNANSSLTKIIFRSFWCKFAPKGHCY